MGLINDLSKQYLIEDFSGSAITAAANVSPSKSSMHVIGIEIKNVDTTDDLKVSVDGGTTYHTLIPGEPGEFSVNHQANIQVKSANNTASYEGRMAVEQ